MNQLIEMTLESIKHMPKSLSTHTREAYKATPQYDLDQILAKIYRWQRKATIARNKLVEANRELEIFAQTLVSAAMKKENPSNETR